VKAYLAAGALTAGVTATVVVNQGERFEMTRGDAVARLMAMDLPEMGPTGASGDGIRGPTSTATGVRSTIVANGVELAVITADVAEDGPFACRVKVDFERTGSLSKGKDGEIGEALFDTRLMHQLVEDQMREQIAATLENRKPDPMGGQMRTAQALMADPSMQKEFGDALGTMFQQVDQQLREGSFSHNSHSEAGRIGRPDRQIGKPDPDIGRPTVY